MWVSDCDNKAWIDFDIHSLASLNWWYNNWQNTFISRQKGFVTPQWGNCASAEGTLHLFFSTKMTNQTSNSLLSPNGSETICKNKQHYTGRIRVTRGHLAKKNKVGEGKSCDWRGRKVREVAVSDWMIALTEWMRSLSGDLMVTTYPDLEKSRVSSLYLRELLSFNTFELERGQTLNVSIKRTVDTLLNHINKLKLDLRLDRKALAKWLTKTVE